MEEDFEDDAVVNRKPVKLLENGSDVVYGGGFGNNAGRCILNQLKFMEKFVREAEKEGITIVCAGSDEGVNQDSSAARSE